MINQALYSIYRKPNEKEKEREREREREREKSATYNDRQLIRLINQKLFLLFFFLFPDLLFCTAVAISTHNTIASHCQTYR